MKKFLMSLATATIVAAPLVAAVPADAAQRRVTETVRHQPGRTVVTHRVVTRGPGSYRAWRKGQRFDRRYARNYTVVNNWQAYRGRRLYAPPRGYHWVRSGNDAVLVAVTGGLIGAVLAGAFN